MKILIATNNYGKFSEISDLLNSINVFCLSPFELNLIEPEETGQTFAENALIKAKYYAKATNNTNIQKAIAKVGYDTQDFTGDNKAYSKLHGCCKYERKQLETSPKTKG